MLIAYNQEQFITEAVQGAFSQTYSPLEIILSDDCSPDRTFEIMQEMAAQYQGPHTIVVNRNERNLGLIGHINRVMEFAKGDLILAAAGDDISLHFRTEEIYRAYCFVNKKAYSIYSQAILIDELGNQIGTTNFIHDSNKFSLSNMAEHQISVPGSTQAWQRSVFDFFGGLDDRVMSEDISIPFRAKLLGDIYLIDKPLVKYRYHNNNTWQQPRNANFFSTVSWQIQQHEKRITSLVGVWQTKINDFDQIILEYPHMSAKYVDLKSRLLKRFREINLEDQYLKSPNLRRVLIIINAIALKVPITRWMRWIAQYSFPYIYYFFRKTLISFNNPTSSGKPHLLPSK